MPNPETSMPIKRKNPEACGVSGPKCITLAMKSGKSRSNPPSRKMIQNSRHEIGEEQKQPAFEEDDPTINLDGFCSLTLLRRREEPFEHPEMKLLRSPCDSRAFAQITTSFRGTSSDQTARNRRAFRQCRRTAWEFQVHPGSPRQCRLCRCRRVWSRSGQ
jgi:hypothetical protein